MPHNRVAFGTENGQWYVYRCVVLGGPYPSRGKARREAELLSMEWHVPMLAQDKEEIHEHYVPGTDVGEPAPGEWVPDEG